MKIKTVSKAGKYRKIAILTSLTDPISNKTDREQKQEAEKLVLKGYYYIIQEWDKKKLTSTVDYWKTMISVFLSSETETKNSSLASKT